jgi:hypothetical protein
MCRKIKRGAQNERKNRKYNENARASLEIDGFYLSEEKIQLVRDRLTGKITEKQFLQMALEMAKSGK